MKRFNSAVLLAALLALAPTLVAQTQHKSLAPTPPLGWNAWNAFQERVDDKDIREAADYMVSSGMRDAGYTYINIDDTWQGERDAQGVLHTNSKFPDMKALADYVHSKGLKFGIYSSPGRKTCAGYEGSLGHEQQDADLYASWGVDLLKYDLCSYIQDVMEKQAPNDWPAQYKLMRGALETMHQAILKTGRPMLYSLCQYGFDSVWQWGAEVGGDMWRIGDDIKPTFDSITLIGRTQAGLSRFEGPGHWNDPDMMEIGNGKLTPAQNRVHMTLWAMLAAPIIAGNDLTRMTPDIREVLTNRGILAIDQDKLGRGGERVYEEGPLEVWTRPLADGSTAIALFNFRDSELELRGTADHMAPLKLTGKPGPELWTGTRYTSLNDFLSKPIAPYTVRIVRLTK